MLPETKYEMKILMVAMKQNMRALEQAVKAKDRKQGMELCQKIVGGAKALEAKIHESGWW